MNLGDDVVISVPKVQESVHEHESDYEISESDAMEEGGIQLVPQMSGGFVQQLFHRIPYIRTVNMSFQSINNCKYLISFLLSNYHCK